MDRRSVTFSVLVALVLVAGPVSAQEADPIRTEANRRNDALVHEGYNLTQGWSVKARTEKAIDRLQFVVPTSEGEHTFSFWAATREGEIAFRLLGPEGTVQASWSGRQGELTVSRPSRTGKHAVEIEWGAGGRAWAVFGVKGAALSRCEPDRGSVREHAAAPASGFHWPYLLFVPSAVRSRHLLVVPNNTGFSTEDLELLRVSGSCEIKRQTALAERLGAPLLVPLFPRPSVEGEAENLYLHALSRASLETRVEALRRVDLQLLAMIDDARKGLREEKVDTEAKVLLWGFSASASFVSRMAVLHPDRVAAVACGSPGGWPIAPAEEDQGERLDYPVGVADLAALVGKPLDKARIRRVSWLLYMGGDDANDSVPYRDSFSSADEKLIFRLFGKTPASRWEGARRLYEKAGFDARFILYPGAAHSVTPEMEKDVTAFFEKASEPR